MLVKLPRSNARTSHFFAGIAAATTLSSPRPSFRKPVGQSVRQHVIHPVGPKDPLHMRKRVLGVAGTRGAGEPLSYLSAHCFGRRREMSDANLVHHRIYGRREVFKYMARLGFNPIGYSRVWTSQRKLPKPPLFFLLLFL